jgi:preprotein translocase subunit SecE
MGGFDHTMLNAQRLTGNQFKFTAVYNDESNRVIWPKNISN